MAEKALLKYCNWKININSPSDFIDMIYNNLLIKYNNNNDIIEKINKYKDISITLLEFAICEYNIFSKYNQFIICLSSCLISMKQIIDEEEINQCNENGKVNNIDIQNELKEILDNIINNINFDKNLIDSCSSLILSNLEKDDEQNEEKVDNEKENEIKEKENEDMLNINNQLEITRNDSDSNVSFCEIMNNYIYEKSFDNNEKENCLINMWKISPISNISKEDSLNIENNDNLFFFDDKELNKDKNKFDILDNGDLLLLKRKRNKN